ncbi:hypothetical protein [Agromyces archimandritae]|uniref:Uncharacterized protein n=1 Tax=Agromyces archimandritae TaxID=2781962 RepID=A0A975IMI0_9MICO|nr:hypothetical protein [Agromyces archimandritae]QTX03532.1 hypothetical protein G127AT_09190 [Agromyces archimandritae]
MLAGCAAQGELPAPDAADTVDPAAAAPAFEGPFAAEYTTAWQETESQFVRDAILDETVSDAELAEAVERLKACTERHGMHITEYNGGRYTVAPSDVGGEEGNQILGACEKASGEHPLALLHRSAIINPENRDRNELKAECLIRNGAVATSYTAEEFAHDNTTLDFPFLDPASGEAIFWRCNDDPRTGQ